MKIMSGIRETGIGLPNGLGAEGGAGGVRIYKSLNVGILNELLAKALTNKSLFFSTLYEA